MKLGDSRFLHAKQAENFGNSPATSCPEVSVADCTILPKLSQNLQAGGLYPRPKLSGWNDIDSRGKICLRSWDVMRLL